MRTTQHAAAPRPRGAALAEPARTDAPSPGSRRPRFRLLPVLVATMAIGIGNRLYQVVTDTPDTPAPVPLLTAARANAETRPATPAPAAPAATPSAQPASQPASQTSTGADPRAGMPMAIPTMAPPEPTPEERAERAVLEALRARRTEIDAREQALATREMVQAAAERRLAQRIEEMSALQQRLDSATRALSEREEQGWRQMVKLYETMRPRDAAAVFDEMEMPVLVEIVARMGERKAAPVLGAMKPDRVRALTAELARARARPTH